MWSGYGVLNMYTKIQKIIHWVMGIVILGMLLFGFFMEDLPNDLKPMVYMMHKSIGLCILLLIPIRLLAKIQQQKIIQNTNLSILHQLMIKVSVPVLYVMMFLMSFSGFIMSNAAGYSINFFGMISLPLILEKSESTAHLFNEMHEILAPIFLVIAILHILAAFYHHFYLKDETLNRMI